MEDTIAAISTPLGQGGIAIVRMSGPRSIDIAEQFFLSREGRLSSFPTHTIHHGRIADGKAIIDDVLVSIMRGPKTYTAEDTVEINCHGGVVSTRLVLGTCLRAGARLAEPGEFTKRAFLNGKLDLAQAESVMDLIAAQTELAHAGSVNVLAGKLTQRVSKIADKILTILAHLEAHIDFPDEDIKPDAQEEIKEKLSNCLVDIEKLLLASHAGKVLRNGVKIAIVGRPNVGKSSLLNALLREDRAIVTPHPGTTRDTIEETSDIRGIPVHFIDTAGIRKKSGIIESKGVERSHNTLISSDIVIFIVDGSRGFSKEDAYIESITNESKTICVVSKADLKQKIGFPNTFTYQKQISISVTSQIGIQELEEEIEKRIWIGKPPNSETCFTMNERHVASISTAKDATQRSIQILKEGLPLELVAQELRFCINALGEITGKTTTEDILERVFSAFCVGK